MGKMQVTHKKYTEKRNRLILQDSYEKCKVCKEN